MLRGKKPLTNRGCKDATVDKDMIARWWTANPTANIGLATGGPNGLFVVDVDGEDGEANLAKLEAKHGALPATVEARTGRGRHLYFGAAETIGNSAGKLGAKLDVRGAGGYVIVPPSFHPSGAKYEWREGHALADMVITMSPDWLVDMLTKPPAASKRTPTLSGEGETISPSLGHNIGANTDYGQAALQAELGAVGAAPEGQRNDVLNRAAFALGQLVAGGELDETHVVGRLTVAAANNGLDQGEIDATIRSGLAAGMREPRQAPESDEAFDASSNASIAEDFDAVDSTASFELHPLDWTALQDQPVPERKWIVQDWIPKHAVTLLGGDGGLGKSIIGMQLLTAAAIGDKWLGRETLNAKAIGFFCEDTLAELHIRQHLINEHFGCEFSDLEAMQAFPRRDHDNLLISFDKRGHGTPTKLCNDLADHAVAFGAKILVLDSLHDLFAGNENSRTEARRFMGLLAGVATRIDGCVVVIYHPSLSGLSSGSGTAGNTAWSNAARSRIYMSAVENEKDCRILSRKKSNYSAPGDEFTVTYEAGVFVADVEPGGIVGAIKKHNVEDAFLTALDALTKSGAEVGDSKQGIYAPKIMVGLPQTKGFSLPEIERAMHRLLANGSIKMEQHGSPSRHKRRLVRS